MSDTAFSLIGWAAIIIALGIIVDFGRFVVRLWRSKPQPKSGGTIVAHLQKVGGGEAS